jgi:hypothetical protein
MDKLEMLVAKDEIDTALNDYVLGMDLHQPERFLSAWHADGLWTMNSAMAEGELTGRGHAEIRAALEALWADQQLVMHLAGNQSIEFDDDTHAHGDGHAAILGVTAKGEPFNGGCVYVDDRFELRDGKWGLTQRRIEVNYFAMFRRDGLELEFNDGFGGAFAK